MKYLFIVATLLISTAAFTQDKDTLDFFFAQHVKLINTTTQDTFVAHEISYSDLLSRSGTPTSDQFISEEDNPMGTGSFHEVCYSSNCFVVPNTGATSFYLESSSTFKLLVFDAFEFSIGDNMSDVREIFPISAKHEAVDISINEGGLFVPYFAEIYGTYEVTDFGLYFAYDLTSEKILRIMAPMD